MVASNQGVSQGPAAKRAKVLEEQYNHIKDKVLCLEKNVNKRIDRLQGTVSYMAKCVEDFNENFAVIMEVVRDKRALDVADTMKEDVVFPLQTTDDVDAYLEKDPQAIKAIDRSVPLANCIFPMQLQLSTYLEKLPMYCLCDFPSFFGPRERAANRSISCQHCTSKFSWPITLSKWHVL